LLLLRNEITQRWVTLKTRLSFEIRKKCQTLVFNLIKTYLFYFQGYNSVCGFDLWTSGSNFGTDDFAWASGKKPFKSSDLNWKSGQPKKADGDCVAINFSNQTANDSTFSLGNCADEKFFICEVKLIFNYLLIFMKVN